MGPQSDPHKLTTCFHLSSLKTFLTYKQQLLVVQSGKLFKKKVISLSLGTVHLLSAVSKTSHPSYSTWKYGLCLCGETSYPHKQEAAMRKEEMGHFEPIHDSYSAPKHPRHPGLQTGDRPDQRKSSSALETWKLRMFAFKIKVDLTSATNMLQKALILKSTKEISSFLV